MKRIKTIAPKHSIIEEVPKPIINDDEILIRITLVGVCMSEHYGWQHIVEGNERYFGHEPFGVVEAVGKNVKDFKVGDKVSGMWGSTLPGGGGMVEYVKIGPDEFCGVYHVPEGVREVDYILEPLACMMSAVSKARIPMPGTEVCVVGAGYMGCGAISLLKMRGAYVVAVDPRPESRENALKYGAYAAYSPEEMWEKFNNGERYEVVMEWAETDESLDLAVHLTKRCGQLCIGAYHTGAKRAIDMRWLNMEAIDCLSTHPREWEIECTGAINAVRMLNDGRWDFKNIPTKVYPMSKFDQAQEELETKFGKYMKAVIDMTKIDGEPYII